MPRMPLSRTKQHRLNDRTGVLPCLTLLCVIGLVLAVVPDALAGEWRQFRGPDSTGIAVGETPPTTWTDTTNIAWKQELPGRGLSGPIVVKGRVVLTASNGAEDDRLHVLCFDQNTGKPLWHRQFWATGPTLSHQKMCNATPTPASDGERIFAFFSSNDVICLDLDGGLLWYRGMTVDYPNASNSLGMSSSLLVVDKTLIVQVENDSESLTAGLDVATGANKWKLNRPQLPNWTSPGLLKVGEKQAVLITSGEGVLAVAPETGDTLWTFGDGGSTIPSAGVSSSLLVVPAKGGLTALEPSTSNSAPKVLWTQPKLTASTPTPVIYKDLVMTVNRGGVLSAGKTATGEPAWQLRLTGPFSGTPVIANDHAYLFNEAGLGQVVKLTGDQPELVSQHDFGEGVLCTPAIADNALFVRSDKHLWKIAAP
jgi:outer membrane protein assembly factor BamB